MQLRAALGAFAATATYLMITTLAAAQSAVLPDSDGSLGFGAPTPAGLGFQTAVTDIMEQITWFEV
ncbi:MAG: hypothetical protein AAGH82_10525, partial [Pseudomonadota bacterium]